MQSICCHLPKRQYFRPCVKLLLQWFALIIVVVVSGSLIEAIICSPTRKIDPTLEASKYTPEDTAPERRWDDGTCYIWGYRITWGLDPVQAVFGLLVIIALYIIWNLLLAIRRCAKSTGLIRDRSNAKFRKTEDGTYVMEHATGTELLDIDKTQENDTHTPVGPTSFVIEDDSGQESVYKTD